MRIVVLPKNWYLDLEVDGGAKDLSGKQIMGCLEKYDRVDLGAFGVRLHVVFRWFPSS